MAREAERQHPRRAEAGAPDPEARVGSGSLTAKLGVCIVAFGLIGAGLLSTRQSRLQAAHEVTSARLRIREHDERLLTLRTEIAARVSPSAVRELLEQLDIDPELAPIAGRTLRYDLLREEDQTDPSPEGEPVILYDLSIPESLIDQGSADEPAQEPRVAR